MGSSIFCRPVRGPLAPARQPGSGASCARSRRSGPSASTAAVDGRLPLRVALQKSAWAGPVTCTMCVRSVHRDDARTDRAVRFPKGRALATEPRCRFSKTRLRVGRRQLLGLLWIAVKVPVGGTASSAGARARRSIRSALEGGSHVFCSAAPRRGRPAPLAGGNARVPHGQGTTRKGQRYPADPPTVEEIIAVMREAQQARYGHRLNGLIVVLWRAGLRINEALSLTETDLDERRGSILVRHGKTIAGAR
jgi:integrase